VACRRRTLERQSLAIAIERDAGMEIRRRESLFELLHHERYTADEVARLLGISVRVIRHAAFSGELRAQILEHHILSLRREDVITWVMAREERELPQA
jgi:hypothetical protein